MKNIFFIYLLAIIPVNASYSFDCLAYLGSQNQVCQDAATDCESGCDNHPEPTGVCSDDLAGCLTDCVSAKQACHDNAYDEYLLCLENQ